MAILGIVLAVIMRMDLQAKASIRSAMANARSKTVIANTSLGRDSYDLTHGDN